jgi:hypothetical protein
LPALHGTSSLRLDRLTAHELKLMRSLLVGPPLHLASPWDFSAEYEKADTQTGQILVKNWSKLRPDTRRPTVARMARRMRKETKKDQPATTTIPYIWYPSWQGGEGGRGETGIKAVEKEVGAGVLEEKGEAMPKISWYSSRG